MTSSCDVSMLVCAVVIVMAACCESGKVSQRFTCDLVESRTTDTSDPMDKCVVKKMTEFSEDTNRQRGLKLVRPKRFRTKFLLRKGCSIVVKLSFIYPAVSKDSKLEGFRIDAIDHGSYIVQLPRNYDQEKEVRFDVNLQSMDMRRTLSPGKVYFFDLKALPNSSRATHSKRSPDCFSKEELERQNCTHITSCEDLHENTTQEPNYYEYEEPNDDVTTTDDVLRFVTYTEAYSHLRGVKVWLNHVDGVSDEFREELEALISHARDEMSLEASPHHDPHLVIRRD